MGLHNEIVGITKFCVDPIQLTQSVVKVGGTKNVDVALVKSLSPDIVIANKEENVKEQIEEIETFSKVLLTDVITLSDALKCIELFGDLFNKKQEAQSLTSRISEEFESIVIDNSNLKACYLIWNKPIMSVGGDTFIHHMIELAGFKNCLGDKLRYPSLSLEELKMMNPDILLLSSEPFLFKESHQIKYQKELPNTKVILVEGTYFSWYGSTLLETPRYFNQIWSEIRKIG